MPDTNLQRSEQRRVSGHVRLEDGTPADAVIVRAFSKTLQDEQLLGQGTTDQEGLYEIRYSAPPLPDADAATIDLVVKALARDGSLLTASPTQFNAPAVVELDLTIPAEVRQPPSLLEKITRAIEPLLERASLLELEQDDKHQDLSFLSGKTGYETQTLVRFVLAHRLAGKALAPEVWFALLGSSPFQSPKTQTIAEQTVAVLNRLPSLDTLAVRKALGRSINQKEIPALSPKQIDKAVEDSLDLAAEQMLVAETGTTLIRDALVDAQVTDEKKQKKFARLFLEHRALTPGLVAELEKERYFTDKIPDLQTSFQLSDLTRADFCVIKMIKDEFGVRQPADVRMLAKKTETDWIKLVKARHRAKQITLPTVEAGPIAGTKIPPDVEGFAKTLARQFREAFRTAAFASDLEQAMKKRGPLGLSNGGRLRDFLNRYPNFEFLTTSIDDFLNTEDADNRSFVEDVAFRTELKAVQRVFKLAPTFNQTDALLADALHSAQKIYRIGESEFVRRFAGRDGFTSEDARRTWNRAADTHAAVMTIVGDLKSLQSEGLPAVLRNNEEALKAFPNWNSLFAAGDLCECDHCGSVLGPAAYFTDLLKFLSDRTSPSGTTVKYVLFKRRPDLGEIELSCTNSNTLLPYIDLVNEILEDVVAPPQPVPLNDNIEAELIAGLIKPGVRTELENKNVAISSDAQVFPGAPRHWTIRDDQHTYRIRRTDSELLLFLSRQTLFSADEVRANPEYTNDDAYNKLRREVFPLNLPFDLWQLQVCRYLDHLGVPQPRLLALFQHLVEVPVFGTVIQPTDLQLECAWLSISETERQILTGLDVRPWGFWGLQETGNDLPNPASPSVPEQNIKGTWIEVLGHVNVMLNRTELTYKELLQLLDLDYINPRGLITISDSVNSDTISCDISKFRIQNLNQDSLQRVHRFIRLWRKVGCSMSELDLLLPNAGQPPVMDKQITDQALRDISRMQRLKEKTGLDWRSILSFYRDIEHRVYLDRNLDGAPPVETLYQRLFRNKRLDAIGGFPPDPQQLSGTVEDRITVGDKIPGILAAFGITKMDLELIMALLSFFPATILDITVLTKIYRVTALAKALGLSIDQILSLKTAWQQEAYGNATLEFVELVQQVGLSPFSAPELAYLLRHRVQFAPGSGVALKDETVISAMTSIREKLDKINTETQLQLEETPEAFVRRKLGELPILTNERDLTIAIRIIDDTWVGTEGDRATLITSFFDWVLKPEEARETLKKLPDDLSVADREKKLEERFAYVQKELAAFLNKTKSEAFIEQTIAETLQIEVSSVGLLIRELHLNEEEIVSATKRRTTPRRPRPPALIQRTVLLQTINDARLLKKKDDGSYEFEINKATFPNIFHSFVRLYKNAMVIQKLHLDVAEVRWWMNNANPNGMGWMLTNHFPFVDSDDTKVSVDLWANMQQFFAWREALPPSEKTAIQFASDLLDQTKTSEEIIKILTELTGWTVTDLTILLDRLDWKDEGTSSTHLRKRLTKPANLVRLTQCMEALKLLGVNAEQALRWAKVDPNHEDADKLIRTLIAKYDLKQWPQIIRPMQDEFREQKRQALVGWLVTHPNQEDSQNWSDANGLYSFFLLDVEMSACQLTSRLVQATTSVQLFVQRCFMGLEPQVTVKADGPDGDSAWRWWKWMRKYRVWEANRKVFLWPENWIEPELKQDRSQFFKVLENEMLQNEVNQFTAEDSFRNYLEKLNGVAQLEIAGFYQEDDGDEAILHVFGRTPGVEPHLYYYRRFDYRQWTPWEKIDLDIQGDYLIPAMMNKRLFLMWPVFTEVPDELANSTVPALNSSQPLPVSRTQKLLRMQLASSEYRRGRWTPKGVSKDFGESLKYNARELFHRNYHFFLLDRIDRDGRVCVTYDGRSGNPIPQAGVDVPNLNGAFELTGCNGAPEVAKRYMTLEWGIRPLSTDLPAFHKWVEGAGRPAGLDDLTLEIAVASADVRLLKLLARTPDVFKVAPGWHMSYFDRMRLDGIIGSLINPNPQPSLRIGHWLPFFYSDKHRTFLTLPTYNPENSQVLNRDYYPAVKRILRQTEAHEAATARSHATGAVATMTPEQKLAKGINLHKLFPEEPPPPYTDEQLIEFMTRVAMRSVHQTLGSSSLQSFKPSKFHFKNFYHPFVCDLRTLINNPLRGVPALLSREIQLMESFFSFDQNYGPTESVLGKTAAEFYPREVMDFTPDGAYSPYNWELFFHAPLLIANALSRNQRFEEARDWYHFIFNPLGVESGKPNAPMMSKYWITKPFFETTDADYILQRIENILRMLAGDTTVPGSSDELRRQLEAQVRDWRANPFDPHRIANYRTVAYQKTVVMKYLDNLIAWGDYLFRQDSLESINEATQIYLLAAELLGPRPKKIPPRGKPSEQTFNELEFELDKFSNAMAEVENLVPALAGGETSGGEVAPLPTLYFCIPQNEKLLGYWDTISDRLFKIRHCMNIEGVSRQLALFEPPIDPGALVKAVAAGVDIGSALADLDAPLPLYRFNVLLQKANEVCNDVKSLGSSLLVALEKKDAEALTLLRQGQELALLEAIRHLREQQVAEAKESYEAANNAKVVVETRRNYYRDIERLNAEEMLQLKKLRSAGKRQDDAQHIKVGASIVSYLPAIDLGSSGFGGSPVAKFKIGGLELGQAASLAADVLTMLAASDSNEATQASTNAGFVRRWQDWKLQESLAEKELLQIEKQIAAADLKQKIAEKELENHLLQIENARATDEFMRSKYTGEELFQWQVGQISAVYFQSYKLAYDLAKRAERCFRFELGLQESDYIKFGFWDSLRKGLLSGEKLQHDLRRLETAYLEQNRREFELSKSISLLMLQPLELVRLRETGKCEINLPEEIFDLDYPGHYFRRIKSVSISVPCVVGPYTTLSCTLRLKKNRLRINTVAASVANYPCHIDENGEVDDVRFIKNNIPVDAIAASHGQNDSGLFELSFRDERYLPFEGAGVISQWSLELFHVDGGDFGKALRQFDYSTITDAVLHVKYTAREDAGEFKNKAVKHLGNYFSVPEAGKIPSVRMLNLRQEFPTQWHHFLHPVTPNDENIFELEMTPNLFPIRDTNKTLKVTKIGFLARSSTPGDLKFDLTVLTETETIPITLTRGSDRYGNLLFGEAPAHSEIIRTVPSAKWKLTPSASGSLPAQLADLFLIIGYEWKKTPANDSSIKEPRVRPG